MWGWEEIWFFPFGGLKSKPCEMDFRAWVNQSFGTWWHSVSVQLKFGTSHNLTEASTSRLGGESWGIVFHFQSVWSVYTPCGNGDEVRRPFPFVLPWNTSLTFIHCMGISDFPTRKSWNMRCVTSRGRPVRESYNSQLQEIQSLWMTK